MRGMSPDGKSDRRILRNRECNGDTRDRLSFEEYLIA